MYESRLTAISCVPVAPVMLTIEPVMPMSEPVTPGGAAMRVKYEPVYVWSSDHATLIVPLVPLIAFHRMRTYAWHLLPKKPEGHEHVHVAVLSEPPFKH